MNDSHQGRVRKVSNRQGTQRWRAEVDYEDAVTGKRRTKSRTFDTRREAQAHLSELLAEHERQQQLGATNDNLPLADWMRTQWLPAIRPEIRQATATQWRYMVGANVAPYMGAVRLQDLTPLLIKRWHAWLQDSDEGLGLSAKTVRNCHSLLHRAMSDAVEWGLLSANPASNLKLPKVPRRTPRTWSNEQVRAFLKYVEGDRLAAMWRLLATTGIRRGELVHLTWEGVDLKAGELAIGLDGEVKTDGSVRRLGLDPSTVAALRRHKARQAEERLAWGAGWQDTGAVFAKENGEPVKPEWVSREMPRLAAAAGVPRLTPHGLRHTWATLALKAGENPKVVAERLGHSTITTTLDRYSHVIPELDRDVADRVARVIDG